MMLFALFFFFFKAEDGIRVLTVTGVQTCSSDRGGDPRHIRTWMLRGVRQGCALHPPNQRQRQKPGNRGMAGGAGCGGRRKYVHVGSGAASMRLTPPQPDPPRLRQLPPIRRNGVLRCCWWVSTLGDTVD